MGGCGVGYGYKKNSNFPYRFLSILTLGCGDVMLELESGDPNGLAAFLRFGDVLGRGHVSCMKHRAGPSGIALPSRPGRVQEAGVQSRSLGGSSPPPSTVDVAGHPPLWLWGRASVVLAFGRSLAQAGLSTHRGCRVCVTYPIVTKRGDYESRVGRNILSCKTGDTPVLTRRYRVVAQVTTWGYTD